METQTPKEDSKLANHAVYGSGMLYVAMLDVLKSQVDDGDLESGAPLLNDVSKLRACEIMKSVHDMDQEIPHKIAVYLTQSKTPLLELCYQVFDINIYNDGGAIVTIYASYGGAAEYHVPFDTDFEQSHIYQMIFNLTVGFYDNY